MYADDIVLLAKRESELKKIIKKFRKFLKRKVLSLSFDKSKIIVFEKKTRRTKKENQNGKKKEI